MDTESGRTFLVTGGNTGIGLATAMGLARRGGRVYLACRSEAKGSRAIASITAATGNSGIHFLPLDLADLSSVRACAAAFLATGEPLHVLVNNAGVAGLHSLTGDGFELAFGVNHLGHFALTTALTDRLVASAPARIVTVSSDSHFEATGIDFTTLRRRARIGAATRAYAVSKLCNVLFAQELARRLEGKEVLACALHPGVVASDIWRRVPWPVRPIITARMLTTEGGAQTSLFCATSPEAAVRGGAYYADCQESEPSAVATEELGRILWERSLDWTGS